MTMNSNKDMVTVKLSKREIVSRIKELEVGLAGALAAFDTYSREFTTKPKGCVDWAIFNEGMLAAEKAHYKSTVKKDSFLLKH